MKKIIFCFLLLFFMAAENLYSQSAIENSFFSINNAYEFTLPQFEVSLPLPAYAEFRVPHLSGKNIQLDIDDVTGYYFDLSYLDSDWFSFLFALRSREEDEIMEMRILELDYSEAESYFNLNLAEGRFKKVTKLKTKLGKTISFLWANGNGQFIESHIVFKGKYAFAFDLMDAMDKNLKREYLEIIKEFQEKIQPYRMMRYEMRVKNGEFEPKEEKEASTMPKENTGVLTSSSFFQWNDYGYGIRIPEDWEYTVVGNLASTEENHAEVTFDSASLDEFFMTMSFFHNTEVFLSVRSYDKMIMPNVIDVNTQLAKYSKAVDIVVDGMHYKGCYYGSKEYGCLDFDFEANDKFHWISFGGVTQATLPLVEQMLSTMKIENGCSNEASQEVPGLSAQLDLADPQPFQLDEPLPLTHNWPEGELFDCRLVDLGVIIKLPGESDDYIYCVDDQQKTIDDNVIEGVPQNNIDKRLSIYSLNDLSLSCFVSKVNRHIALEKYIHAYQRGWSTNTSTEFIHGSITRVNGLDWCVCIARNQQNFHSASTCHIGDYEITVCTHFNSKEEAFKSVAVLKNVFSVL